MNGQLLRWPVRLKKHIEDAEEKTNLILESDAALSKTGVLIWDEPIEKEEAIRQLLDACCA